MEFSPVDFTREPIIETVITPKEGHKLVIRNSRGIGQEEFFVDAVEVVAFGKAMFFRSVEKPKAFLVPTSDYEVLEVREARMILKHVGIEKNIKIGGGRGDSGGGRESTRESKSTRDLESALIPPPPLPVAVPVAAALSVPPDAPVPPEDKGDGKGDRKRGRRHYRRRRGREEGAERDTLWSESSQPSDDESADAAMPEAAPAHLAGEDQLATESAKRSAKEDAITASSTVLTSLLPPPPTLISETIARYKDDVMFKHVFFQRKDTEDMLLEEPSLPIEEEASPFYTGDEEAMPPREEPSHEEELFPYVEDEDLP